MPLDKLYSWLIIQSCIKITSIRWISESEQTCRMYFNIFLFAKYLQQQALKCFVYNFQTEKFLRKCPSVQHILCTAFCCASSVISAYTDPHILWSWASQWTSSLYEKDTELQHSFRICHEKYLSMKGLLCTPLDRRCSSYISGPLLLLFPLTAAIVLKPFRIELLTGV